MSDNAREFAELRATLDQEQHASDAQAWGASQEEQRAGLVAHPVGGEGTPALIGASTEKQEGSEGSRPARHYTDVEVAVIDLQVQQLRKAVEQLSKELARLFDRLSLLSESHAHGLGEDA